MPRMATHQDNENRTYAGNDTFVLIRQAPISSSSFCSYLLFRNKSLVEGLASEPTASTFWFRLKSLTIKKVYVLAA